MKRTLTGIAAAAVVLGTLAPAAFAATPTSLSHGGGKTISLDGTTLYSGVQVGNATEAGVVNAYFPIYYLQQTLDKAGYTNTYDPGTHVWNLQIPGVDGSKVAVDGGVGSGNSAIAINGFVVKRFNAVWNKDLAGGPNAVTTTYFPLFYLTNTLKAAGFSSAWDGNNFGFTSAANYGQAAGIKVATPSAIVANGAATETVTANVVDTNGNVVKNFNGTVNVAITTNGAAQLTADDATGVTTLTGVAVKNGVAKFDVLAGLTAGATDTITLSNLLPNTDSTIASNVTYTSADISSVAPAATSLKLSIPSTQPTTLTANTQNATQFTVSIKDQSGVTFSTGGAYVTLTLSGQGSFSNTSSQTSETLWVTGTSAPISVYSLAGQAGTISVSAAATGLSNGALAIPTYINTAPNSISVTPTQGTDATTGAAYTQYSVQLLDTLGHPISTATDALNITADAANQGGTIQFGSIDTNGNFVPGMPPTQLLNGVATFAVETVTVGSAPATITVQDTANSFKATAPYSYTAENVAGVDVSPSASTTNYRVTAGQTVTFKAQLVDGNDNNVSTAGQKVLFKFTGANTPGATFPNGDNQSTYAVNTDANGVATVTVTVPSSAGAGTFTVEAEDANLSIPVYVPGATVNVVTGSSYATALSLSGTPTTVQSAGSTIPTVTASPKNAVGDPVAGDTIQVTTSNSSVVAVANPDVAGGSTQTFAAGTYAISGLKAGQAGTATITVTDISNPAKPSKTFSVSVQPSTFVGNIVQYSGKTVSSSNPLNVTANTPVAITVVHADGGNNPVPATSNDWVGLNDGGKGGSFSLTSGGAPVTEVKIPQGQSSVTVYYVNPSTTSVTSFGAADSQLPPASAANSTLTSASTGTAGTAVTYTLTLKDASGNAITGQELNITHSVLAGTGTVTFSAVTETATPGTYQFTATDTKAESLTVGATFNGSTVGAAPVTINAGALASMSGLTYSAETGSAAAGGGFTVATAATGQDANSNTVSATGGTYTITPGTGVSIDPSTGAVTLAAGAATGTYTVTYTVGAVTTTATITVA